MAKKRMISKQIVDSDDFIDMPLSAQALYFHLLVRADDEGFSNGIKKIMRMTGTRQDDLKILVDKSFVIPFESGVVVIKHWLIHNTIRADRIIPTAHIDEKALLSIKENKAYTTNGLVKVIEEPTDICPTNDRIDKNRLDKNSIEENIYIVEETPTIPYQKIITYLNQKLDTKYKATSNKTKQCIKARFNEGFDYNDFIKVIDIKYNEWYKTDMQKYLRPETLFGTKFESYLNQKENTYNKRQDEIDNITMADYE